MWITMRQIMWIRGGGRGKVKRDLIQNLRTTVFRNLKISEQQGSPDFTLSRNFPEFHANQRENVFF